MRPGVRIALFGGGLAVSLGVAFLVLRGHDSPWLALPWLLSLVPFAAATYDRPLRHARAFRPSRAALLLFVAALPVLVRVVNLDPARLHGDEFLTAYFSATHDFAHTNFFGFIPEKWEWQGQFPEPFFFLQRVFFLLFGASTLTLRLSIQIYVAIVSVMLFLIVEEMFNQATALAAVVLYSFFAISVYLETMGFMFVSSTAIFIVFFYLALREYRTGRIFFAAMAGVACGFCYLTYYSSYLAFPVLAVFFAVRWLRTRRVPALQNFLIALGGILIVLAPFLAFGLRSGDYVSPRASQVSLLSGEWSPYQKAIATGASPIPVIREHLKLCLQSFARDGIGGHGGYDFGHLAFFNRFSLVLFLAGVLAGGVLLFRKSEILFVFLVIAAAFLTGIVFTIPPPAYHRFSIAFPFLVIVMALPFNFLLRLPRPGKSIRYALAGGLLLLFACVNERQFTEAVFRDTSYDEFRLSELINQRFAGRNLYVAAFDAFAFQKIFYFRDRSKTHHVETGFHNNLLKKLNRKEKYVYVMILGPAFREQFEKADPNGRYYRFSIGYSLFAN